MELGPPQLSRLEAIASVLRRQEPRERYELTGWIKRVEADALAIDRTLTGVVVVETRFEGRLRDVYIEVAGDLLRHAGEGPATRLLSATGTLEKIRRFWHLTDPTDIVIREP